MIFEGCMDYMARHMPFEGTKSLIMILVMEEILHQLIGCLSLFYMYFLHPRWLFGISEPSTVSFMAPEFITFCHWGLDVLRALQHFADGERRPGAQPRLGPGTEEIGSKNMKKNSKKWAYFDPTLASLGRFKNEIRRVTFFGEMAGERKATHQRNETRERSFSCGILELIDVPAFPSWDYIDRSLEDIFWSVGIPGNPGTKVQRFKRPACR